MKSIHKSIINKKGNIFGFNKNCQKCLEKLEKQNYWLSFFTNFSLILIATSTTTPTTTNDAQTRRSKCYETISLYNQKAMCNKNKPYKSLKSRNIGTRNRYAVTFGIAATVFSLINGYINFAAADSFSNSVHNDGVINRNAWLLPSHEKTYTSSLEKWSSQSSPSTVH